MILIKDIKNNIKSVFQMTDKIKWIEIDKIYIDPEFEKIFIQKETEIKNISENMNVNNFDPAHPIILALCKEHPELNNIIADGHTRYKAAHRAGLTKVAIIYKEFSDREELLRFVYEQQLLRRNLTENEVFNAWSALNRLTDENGRKAKSDSAIAEELQVSRRTVAKMKEVEKKASPEVLEGIKSGEITVNKAYTLIKQEEAKSVDVTEPVVKPEDKNQDVISKYKSIKAKNSDYIEAYTDGCIYALETLRYGKSPFDLQTEILELKEGIKSVESLQDSLTALKECYEYKQTV